jgi:serine/threonine-protein kinase
MRALNIVDHEYILGELIGVGGMARVYTAEDASKSRVAVKMLHPDLMVDHGMVRRLLEEGTAARQVSHDNVVRVLDQGTTADGAPFLAMEHVRGISLGDLIHRVGPLPLWRIRAIASQILSGLAAIHRAGLMHGDMKSGNVLVDSSDGLDRVKIIDFGLARRPGTHLTLLGENLVAGTPDYMAPELIRGEPISVATDLYAVAVILYEMLTGTTPFSGGTTVTIFERQLADEVVPPSLRCPDRTIPLAFERAILHDLDKDASARDGNAELFAAAVERALSADGDDTLFAPGPVAFSTEGPTREWAPPPASSMVAERRPRSPLRTGVDDESVGRPRADRHRCTATPPRGQRAVSRRSGSRA